MGEKRSYIKLIRNLSFFLILIALTFWYVFKDENIHEIFKTIESANIIYVLLGIFCMFLYYLMESYNIKKILVALGDKNISLLNALKFTFIGFFFSAITPAATGGQPVEIYYMSKEKIKTSNATMAMMLELCGYHISSISLSVICMLCCFKNLESNIIIFYIIGFILNLIAFSFILILTFSKKISRKLVNLYIKILKRFKVKNFDLKVYEIEETLKQYNESSLFIKKNKKEFIKVIFRVFLQIVFLYIVPFFTYKSLGLNGHNLIQIFAIQAIFYTTICSVPLPGSIGVSETLFLKLFAGIFTLKYINSAMLINRFVSFYFFVIISSIVTIINALKKKKITSKLDEKIGREEL